MEAEYVSNLSKRYQTHRECLPLALDRRDMPSEGECVLLINGTTTETDASPGSFSYSNVLLNSPSAPKNMAGTYGVISGLCTDDIQSLTLAEQ